MSLQEQDYYRWNSIRNTVNDLAREVAEVMHELRILESESDQPLQTFDDQELLSFFDDIFLNLSSITVSEFVSKLRQGLGTLSQSLGRAVEDLARQ